MLGDAVNYAIGLRAGPRIFYSGESRWLNRQHLERTRRFYELLSDRIRETAGVRQAALSQSPPLNLGGFDAVSFVPEGFDIAGGDQHAVFAGYQKFRPPARG